MLSWKTIVTSWVAAGGIGLAACANPAVPPPAANTAITTYRTARIDGVNVFYREAGPPDAPVLLLLHGFPSSSRTFEPLFHRLSNEYRLIAPDYPGFGHSDAPPPDQFDYTFDHLAEVMDHFAQALSLTRYTLVMHDYGGPVGFRLAIRHPERVQALVIQNANSYEEGLGPLWDTRRAFWADRAKNEAAVRANLLSPEAARKRHLGSTPHPERIDPDTWTDESAFLERPGQATIQLELFYDYRTNVAQYPKWQAYLREARPPTLVLWGKNDPSFMPQGATAYARDLPNAEIHMLEAGHFPLDEAADTIAASMREFLSRKGAPR
ncbi:alpha/beta fold hydrolase [Pendulispora albinea]|uniref:Alpha/beta hydrolase n=1 Tax=Pendulispora albinea TaxID=2741071 RepID=A0ABZ2MA97_9BACT